MSSELEVNLHDFWHIATQVIMYISLALTLWSGFKYIWDNREYLKDM